MKTSLLTVLSFLIISCSQANSNSQSNTIDWPQISDVQIAFTHTNVSISWLADAEPTDVYYEVERSIDGVHFKAVALVLGGFANNQNYTFQFREKKKDTLKVVCRIKQLKQDGSYRIVGERSI